jgi:hypothetical protein
MALSRAERKQQFFNRQFPDANLPAAEGRRADYHLISLIIILSLDEETRRRTFPDDGAVNPEPLFEAYQGVVDRTRVSDDHVRALSRYREAFRGVKMAWAALDGYNPEPCPTPAAIKALAEATKDLPDSGSKI